jgi:hypothetical protein
MVVGIYVFPDTPEAEAGGSIEPMNLRPAQVR